MLSSDFLSRWENAFCAAPPSALAPVELANTVHLYATAGLRPSDSFFQHWQKVLIAKRSRKNGAANGNHGCNGVHDGHTDLQEGIIDTFNASDNHGSNGTITPSPAAGQHESSLLSQFESQALCNALLSLGFLYRKFGLQTSVEFRIAAISHFATLLDNHLEVLRIQRATGSVNTSDEFSTGGGETENEATSTPVSATTSSSSSLNQTVRAALELSPEHFSSCAYALSVLCRREEVLGCQSGALVSRMEVEFLRIITQGLHPRGIAHLVFAFNKFWPGAERVVPVEEDDAQKDTSSNGSASTSSASTSTTSSPLSTASSTSKVSSKSNPQQAEPLEKFISTWRDRFQEVEGALDEVEVDRPLLKEVQKLLSAFEREASDELAKAQNDVLQFSCCSLELYQQFILKIEAAIARSSTDFTETSWNATQNPQRLLLEASHRLRGESGNTRKATDVALKSPFLLEIEAVLIQATATPASSKSSSSSGTGASASTTSSKRIRECLFLLSHLHHSVGDGALIALLDACLADACLAKAEKSEREMKRKGAAEHSDSDEEIMSDSELGRTLYAASRIAKHKKATSSTDRLSTPVETALRRFSQRWETLCLLRIDTFDGRRLVQTLAEFGELRLLGGGGGGNVITGSGGGVPESSSIFPSPSFMQIWELKCVERVSSLEARELILLALSLGRLQYKPGDRFAEAYGRRVEEVLHYFS
ncbi:unnamed protein product [Amoebophrya sp. A25]|nr:unnamed protein product [Amoebophrya sp. A25]|eukprot:GSA25T00007149001.1